MVKLDSYKFPIRNIGNLEEIDNKTCHYVYRNVHFLLKKHPSKTIVVAFHGACKKSSPAFRCYDHMGYNILAISDRVINKYCKDGDPKNVAISWYSNTKKYPDNREIYEALIGHVIKDYDNVLFFGTSAGGLPSLYYSAIFNKRCFISNAQIYAKKYHCWPTISANILKHDDDFLDEFNIIDHFKARGFPAQINYMINMLDVHHYTLHALPFFDELKEAGYENLKLSAFKHNGPNVHNLPWPKGEELKTIIPKVLVQTS